MVNHLTKSQYLHGLQCPKRLWYEKNHPERATTASRSQQLIINQSKEVERLARRSFQGGKRIYGRDPVRSVEQTTEAMRHGIPYIFEASFIFNNSWVRCDVLEKDSNSWKIIEVEASADVNDEHLSNLAFQKYVSTEQGITISGTEVMHINRECVYPDRSNLFDIEDVTDQVDQQIEDVPSNIETFETILEGDVEPEVLIGRHCEKPHPCPFKEHCWDFVPKHSIFTIPYLRVNKQTELIERGIFSLCDVPCDFPLSENQHDYVNMVRNNQPEINNEAIRDKLSELEYPIYFLDFESYNPAIPRFEGLRSYQQFPFQYSCHILQCDGSLTPHEYLHTDTTDPRLPLIESLLDDISDDGSVVVYSASFERKILRDLADFSSEHSEALRSIISRLWDQELIFKRHYKHPEFCGSTSLKAVLPVLVPSLSYEDLDIQEGDEAQAVWNTMINTTNEEARSRMINDLRAYCKMDTLAMAGIHKTLLLHNELCLDHC